MEITLRNHKIVLKVGMERIQPSKEAAPAKAVKNQHILAEIEKENQYAINPAGLYLTQIEMHRKAAAF